MKRTDGEKAVEKYLIENGWDYVFQYSTDKCRNKRNLKFDFAVFANDKLKCLIEYDGIHHFKDRYNDDDAWLESTIRDEIKNSYSKAENIDLIRITYKQLKQIDFILNDYFFRNKKPYLYSTYDGDDDDIADILNEKTDDEEEDEFEFNDEDLMYEELTNKGLLDYYLYKINKYNLDFLNEDGYIRTEVLAGISEGDFNG